MRTSIHSLFTVLLVGLVIGYVLGFRRGFHSVYEPVQSFDSTLRESIKECSDKYNLTMVLQERTAACEHGLVFIEEELDSCRYGKINDTDN